MLGDIQRGGNNGERPLKKGGDGHHRASGIQKQGGARWNLLCDLFTQALFGLRQQRIASLTVHGGEVERDGAAVVLLRKALVFQVGQIPTDGIRRNLQLFSQVGDACLALLAEDIQDVALTSGFVHGVHSCKMSQ